MATRDDYDLVPAGTSEATLRDEANRRSHQAGYTDRDGQMKVRPEIISAVPTREYRDQYVRIFGHE